MSSRYMLAWTAGMDKRGRLGLDDVGKFSQVLGDLAEVLQDLINVF
jgi:hypothetical protein